MHNNYQVGNSGLFVSEIILGTALTIGTEIRNQKRVNDLIDSAFDSSIATFDTASNYGNGNSEKMLGKALKKYDRQEFVLITKAGWPNDQDKNHQGMGRKNIAHSLEKSLASLNTEYVDIFFSHRFNETISITELAFTMNVLILDRKILHWGTSQWPLQAIQKCIAICERYGLEKPIVEQSIYSYLINDIEKNGVKKLCEENGIGIFGFSPLAQGILTGKYENEVPANSRIAKSETLNYGKTISILNEKSKQVDLFLKCCRQFEVHPISAALHFSRQNGVIPIMGCTNSKQLKENVELSKADIPLEFWQTLKNNDHINL